MVNLGKSGLTTMIVMGAFLVLVVGFSVFIPTSNGTWPVFGVRSLDSDLQKGDENDVDPLRLLPPPFDEKSCLSRYRSHLYRRKAGHHRGGASPSLVSKLRSYEARHKRCGPHSEAYNRTIQALVPASTLSTTAGTFSSSADECKYIVWIASSGLGNQILTIASTFLYALLTDRVLLVDKRIGDHNLFCEPFPETSWLLPLDFPLTPQFSSFTRGSPHSYGDMLLKKKNSNLAELAPQPYVYMHLSHDATDHDQQFFCDQEQRYLHRIPWLFTISNNYFLPSFFLMPSFEQELERLFPDKETVFHHLGRYLFQPSNPVWGLVTRFYKPYLSKSDVIVGLQIRVFNTSSVGLPQLLLKQIVACATKENILPDTEQLKPESESSESSKPNQNIAVLVTSLYSSYYERLRNLYWENPIATGESIAVFQPSNEESQQSEVGSHNQKAWAEMYLLSLADKLVTTSLSTFGYVAQGLAGLRPSILDFPNNGSLPDPPCKQGMSMEPCYHDPPRIDCNARRGVDTAEVVPHVRHCEDRAWGIKLFQQQTV